MNKKEMGITLALVVVGGLIVYGLVELSKKVLKKKDADQDQTTTTLKVVTDAA